MANFNKDYVKTSVFPREMGRKIGQAEEIRHASDYDDFYIASKEESERQISVADEFIILAEKYCMEQLECQTAHCGRGKSHFIFGGLASPIVPYRNLTQTTDGITADCRSLV